MKISNIIKNLFNDNEKSVFPLTSTDNVISKEDGKTLDEELRDLKLQVKQLQRYVTPVEVPLEVNSNFNNQKLKCYRIGDLILLVGSISAKSQLPTGVNYEVCKIPYKVSVPYYTGNFFQNCYDGENAPYQSVIGWYSTTGGDLAINISYAGSQYTHYKDYGVCMLFKLNDYISNGNID